MYLLKEAFASDETVALAKQKACEMLGAEEKDVDFEVLQMPERKRLGFFGGRLAQVRAFLKVSPEERARDYLKEVLYYMGLESLNVELVPGEKDECNIDINGQEVKNIVGKHGETLDALQYLCSIVANNTGKNCHCKVRLNAGDYRERRKKSLEALARRMAYRAMETNEKIELEPMRAYERKIIHATVCSMDGAHSWSEGVDNDRHVVIAPGNKSRYEVRYMYDKDFSERVDSTNKQEENQEIED